MRYATVLPANVYQRVADSTPPAVEDTSIPPGRNTVTVPSSTRTSRSPSAVYTSETVFPAVVVAYEVSDVGNILRPHNAVSVCSERSYKHVPVDIAYPVADVRLTIDSQAAGVECHHPVIQWS